MPIFIFLGFTYLIPVAPPVIAESLMLGYIAFILMFIVSVPLFIYDLHFKQYEPFFKYLKLSLTCKYYYYFIFKLIFRIFIKKIKKVASPGL